MANKNHKLDKPIVEAARKEFLQKGFQSASINNIAKNAGVTTGAIYTRYKGKDELFYSLIEVLLNVLEKERKENKEAYMKYCIDSNFDNFLSNIEKETEKYIDILFEYYDECKLLLCCSKGSSVESMFGEMIKNKISETKMFIEKNIAPDISMLKLDLVELLMNQQFSVYASIIQKGYNKEETMEYIKFWGEFIEAGWERIFKEFINKE